MKNALTVKVIVVCVVSMVMLLVIHAVGGVVDERQERQKSVVEDIANSYSAAQRTASPFLVMPYTEEIDEVDLDKQGNRVQTTRRIERALAIFPERIDVLGDASTDWKHRGLFRALVYQWIAKEKGTIRVPSVLPYVREKPDSRITEGTPYLVVALSDTRGLVDHPVARFNGHPLVFDRGGNGRTPAGMYAAVPNTWIDRDHDLPLDLSLAVRGTESFDFVPYGSATHVSLASSWPHPSFGGSFLPDAKSQQVSAHGFSASWLVDGLASSANGEMGLCVAGGSCVSFDHEQAISVHFIEPVNIYSLSNRAIKYAFLFVELIFAAFFLFEMVKRLRIHPAQYLLVGFAIALFFLLLISLSEHLDFVLAYLAAALACTSLITVYLATVLGGIARGLAFGAGLSVLFGALYVLLQSEDDSLALGSVLLFGLLAVAMFATRKLDWYALQGRLA